MTLTLDDLTGESGTQLGLLPEARESDKRRLVEVDRELRARTGGSSRPVPGGGGCALAPSPGDAGPAGSRRLIGKR